MLDICRPELYIKLHSNVDYHNFIVRVDIVEVTYQQLDIKPEVVDHQLGVKITIL